MKKYLIATLLGVLGIMIFNTPVFAATNVSFNPVNVSVRQDQIFVLKISINSQGIKNYTAKMEISYPADLLEIRSFNFVDGWVPLSQPSYNLIDNKNGLIVKTAGYPGGVSSPIDFGIISFVAKKSGNGTIVLDSNSFVLNTNSQDVLSDAPVQTAVAISTSTLTPMSTPTSTLNTTPMSETTTLETEQLTKVSSVEGLLAKNSNFFLATISGAITLGTGDDVVGIIVLFSIGLIIYLAYPYLRGKKKKTK